MSTHWTDWTTTWKKKALLVNEKEFSYENNARVHKNVVSIANFRELFHKLLLIRDILQIWPQMTLFVSKLEVEGHFKEIWFQRWNQCSHKSIFRELRQISWSRRDQEIELTLDEVYRPQGRLTWRIKEFWWKTCIILFKWRTYWPILVFIMVSCKG